MMPSVIASRATMPFMDEPMLDERTLRYARAIDDAGSIRAAARTLGIAPSAIQRSMAAAERRLGTALFERSASGTRITATGEVVVRHARARADLDARMAAELHQATTGHEGTATLALGLGFIEAAGNDVVAPLLQELPGIVQHVHIGGTDELTGALERDDADIAVVLHARPSASVTVHRTQPQPMGLAARPGHPLTRHRTLLRPRDLDGVPATVLPPGFGLRTLHDEFERVHGISMPARLESASRQVLISAIRATDLVALLPPAFTAGSGVELVDVDDEHLRGVQAAVLTRRGRELPPAAQHVLEACISWFDQSGVA